jgi:hypothetical protein
MATFRAQMSFPMDTALPKDAITINPHFNGSDAQALANALSTNILAQAENVGHPHTIKIYDAATPPPSYPLATVTVAGTPPTSGVPREVAICCSYYTTYNRPRYRGRLYLPATWFSAVANVRPTQAIIDRILTWFKAVFGAGLPPATNLVVWSRVEKKSMGGVNHLWVDDEYDTQRSRGLTALTRTTSTFP